MQAARLTIFCDGGIGNRINALASGLAIAHHYGLSYCVHWPENNWCAASFSDIFKSQHPTSRVSIKDLHNQCADAIVLLHDEIASTALNVTFHSAYDYQSLEDFDSKVISTQKNIFYYPAIFPEWIPSDLIHKEINHLMFSDFITHEVKQFIIHAINKPFYGLHLRRTDLNVGLSDNEVLSLVTQHKDKDFFVCSDDPLAEALASVHPNVHRREKTVHVEKKNSDQGWLAQCKDDDERTYYGNIFRSKDSVIEGTIDMLILAHSEIIGYSGSTFQRMARLIGELNPIIAIEKPLELQYFSVTETSRRIQSKLMPTDLLLQVCNTVHSQGNINDAINLLQLGYEYESGTGKNAILFTLGIYYLNDKMPSMAAIIFDNLTQSEPKKHSNWLHLAYASLLANNKESAFLAYQKFISLDSYELPTYELSISKFIASRINLNAK
jgi:hypothetical protein